MPDVASWGWYQPSTFPGWDSLNQSNIDARLDGASVDTSFYVEFLLRDADADGVIEDSDTDDGSFGSPTEYVIGPSLTLQPAEIGLYVNSTMVADGQVFTGLAIEVSLFEGGTWGVRIIDSSIPDNIFPHEVTSVTLGAWNGEEYSGNFTATIDEPLCLAPDAPVLTPGGPRPAGDLRPGDLVETLDHGARPLIWVADELAAGFGIARAPVIFPAGAFGARRTLGLSPQHLVMLGSARAQLLFGSAEVLAPARALVGHQGVRQAPIARTRWVHLMCAEHEVLQVGGLPCESFRPGPRSVLRLSCGQMTSLRQVWDGRPVRAARPVLRFWQARLLLAGHASARAPVTAVPG